MVERHSQSNPNPAARLRILCVDDHADFAQLWSSILDGEPDMESVGTLPNADQLEEECRTRGTHAVLVDLTMPGRNPIEAIDSLRRSAPGIWIIAFSGYDDAAMVATAKAAGAHGLISKSLDPQGVIDRIRRIVALPAAVAPTGDA
jgi:DNA-binding NarL/FixJ family response regulator